MAGFTERINVLIDVKAQSAAKAFRDLKADVAAADGVMGKFKVAGGAAMNFVKQNAVGLASAGGAALAAFGAKAVSMFQSTALEAGKFADATGLAVEEASRWAEVAGDIGIDAGVLEKSIGKLNRELGQSPDKLAALGVEVVRTRDGAVDLNETFLRTIDVINSTADPTKKAALAQQAFGRGWQEMAELIGMGADDLRASLAAVSDQKVIDKGELAEARKFRDNLDELKDKAEDFALALGEQLVPVVNDLLDLLGPVADGVKLLSDSLTLDAPRTFIDGDLNQMLADFAKRVEEAHEGAKLFGETWGRVSGEFVRATQESRAADALLAAAAAGASRALNAQAEAHGRATRLANDQKAAWEGLTGALDNDEAILDLADQFDELNRKFGEAWEAGVKGAEDAEKKNRDYQRAIIDTKRKVLEYGQAVDGIPKESASKIVALLDEGSLEEAERRLGILLRNRSFTISANSKGLGGVGYARDGGKRASGGPTSPDAFYEVAEGGKPELYSEGGKTYLIPGGNGRVTPAASGAGGGGGAPVVVNVYPQTMPTNRELAEWVEKAKRQGFLK